ncbi:MAG: glycosyltransferase family 39 protein [Rhodocyclaceae bacterium]|nr:glycosyltransferase family 39 protein [Rhodocyclaceae bacterium]
MPSAIGRRTVWLLVAAFTLLWFGTLDQRALIKPDEGRYAEIAREMALAGDWVTPRLNGIKYFEKPPLQYWATAAAFKAFGEDEWTARLWPALTGWLAVLAVGFAGSRLFGPGAGLAAAAVLGSSLLAVVIGHFNVLDMGLTAFLTLALAGLLMANREAAGAAQGRRWMLLTWAALALAVLSKGLVALVLAGGTLVLYSLLARDLSPWRRLHPVAGILVFLAIAAPWFVAVSLANPEFPRFFFIHEHFERFLTTTHRRTQPAWYFLPVLLAGALPWTFPVLQAWWQEGLADRGRPFRPRLLLAVWALVIIGFFSLSGSKLPSYILPMFPALALLAGAWVAKADGRLLARHFAAAAVLAAVAAGIAPRVADRADEETPREMTSAYALWLTGGAATAAAACGLGAWLAHRGRREWAVFAMAAGGVVAAQAVLLGHDSLGESNSAKAVAARLGPTLRPDAPFYSVQTYDQTLPFYFRRTVTLVDYRDELDFGLLQEPALAVPDLAGFEARWRRDPLAYALMAPGTYARMAARGLPMQVLARDGRRVIVSNRPQ